MGLEGHFSSAAITAAGKANKKMKMPTTTTRNDFRLMSISFLLCPSADADGTIDYDHFPSLPEVNAACLST
jgi:hypothetical protein